MAKRGIDSVSPKTSEEAFDFVRKMQEAFPKTPRSKKELAALQKYLAKFKDAELRAVGSRVLSDLMQRPPRTIHEGDLPPTPVAGPEPDRAPPPRSGPRTKPRAGRARKRTTAVARRRTARRRARRS
ncbi:MAG: hypothetical protein WEG40_13455 [Candidatus Rokuibacteriota bacterium]